MDDIDVFEINEAFASQVSSDLTQRICVLVEATVDAGQMFTHCLGSLVSDPRCRAAERSRDWIN